MSTIRVDNFGPSAGGTTYSARGIAKAWVHVDNDQSTVEDSQNVSSAVDEGVGLSQVNLTNAFTGITYGFVGMTGGASAGYAVTARGRSTGAFDTRVGALSGDTASDVRFSLAFLGDLA